MRKMIILNKAEADKIPLASKSKNGIVGSTDKKAIEKMLVNFRDINGRAYLLMHGSEDGYLSFYGCAVDPFSMYRLCVQEGHIKKGEHLNIICCHGKRVYERAMAMSEDERTCYGEFNQYRYSFSFVNTTEFEATISKIVLNNGNVRLTVETHENKLSNKLYRLMDCI
jgi:hypothetical protein